MAHAEQRQAQAQAEPDPNRAFQLHEAARSAWRAAADEFARLRQETDNIEVQSAALRNAVALYYRAQDWPGAIHALDLAERLMRAHLQTPAPSRATLGRHVDRTELKAERRRWERGNVRASAALIEVIDGRANLHSKLFELPAAIADFREVARLDSDGKHGIDALHTAARLAYHDGDFATSTALDATIVRRFAKDPKHRDAVDDSAWRIVEAAERSGERQAWIRALGAYLRRREVSANAEPTRQLAREILDRLQRGLPGRPPPPPSPLANVLAHPPLFVVADPPGTAPGLERELR